MAKRKIVLVGCGAVGSSFIYSAINQGLAQEYVLIDAFEGIAEGNAIDFADCQAALDHPFISIKAGNYSDCKDADIIVITAGRPQKDGETRLNMVADNAKIMKSIALEIKKSGFKGVTIIASNPVDIMTTVYQKITQFDYHQVLGSGTILDTLRLQYLIGEKIAVNPKSVAAYVIGEHGDSSMIPWSSVSVGNKTIYQQITEGRIKEKDLEELRKEVAQRAYKIIKLKRATFYGIGAALALLVRNILEGQNHVLVAGAYLQGEYGQQGFYIGVPTILYEKGWKRVVKLPLTKEEQTAFDKSCAIIKETLETAFAAIK
ncbi:L-lactate dehydrogenase [Spiroplasma endosymbiont of Nomada rufipes]|uniref:L-lactate dehydrogenase n=1 Tax=Spiroplasma endosymbiont of Nomada rufipes TaxID=3077933 RepID=UPI00376EE770